MVEKKTEVKSFSGIDIWDLEVWEVGVYQVSKDRILQKFPGELFPAPGTQSKASQVGKDPGEAGM